MANTRSMTRKLTSWSDLDHDLLFLIMMHLGLFDFAAFSSVCTSWRSLAVSKWNTFMMSKQPMCLSISSRLKVCYLKDYKRRKLRTTISHSNGSICVGITCGYLIFFERATRDFLLVNPFTRKELRFVGFPFYVSMYPKNIRGVLVYSPSMSGWVFVVITGSDKIAFSLPGEQGGWYYVVSPYLIHDLHFFKGKVYTIDVFSDVSELRLTPQPTLTSLKMKDFPWTDGRRLWSSMEFVSSSDNLYLVDASEDAFAAIEVDFGEMKWVTSERTIGDHAVFLSNFKCAAAIKPDTWLHPWTHYGILDYIKENKLRKKRRKCFSNMWYFPHDCLIGDDAAQHNTVYVPPTSGGLAKDRPRRQPKKPARLED
ncbi:hypothetical protein M8C21_014528 [Ambrosia artemisiifolia]|uniref:F-box domain-containing protein n=1 Tax=Ambrosia artemisiifolia TaxID=4212 RepID=A0AAD5CB07_AMBAR|nr:hypothetical protein M8C21_014528 [Ambrosia artemisiifolia]